MMKKITLLLLIIPFLGIAQGPWEFNNSLDTWSSSASYTLNSDNISFALSDKNTIVLEHSAINVNGDLYGYVAVTLRNTSDGNGPDQLRGSYKKLDGTIQHRTITIANDNSDLITYYIDLSSANWDNIDGNTTGAGEQIFQVALRNRIGIATVEIHKIEFVSFIPKPEKDDYTFSIDTDYEGWLLNGNETSSSVSVGVFDIELPTIPASGTVVQWDQTDYQLNADSYAYLNIEYRNESANDQIRFQFRSIANNYGNLNGVNVSPDLNMVAPNFKTIQFDLANIPNASWYGVVNDFRLLIRNEQIQIDEPLTYTSDVTTDGNLIISRIYFTNEVLSTEKIEKDDTSLSFYPNPVSDVLTVQSKNRIEKIEVYNLLGQKIMTKNSPKIDVSNLSKGIYISKIHQENDVISTKRFVKE